MVVMVAATMRVAVITYMVVRMYVGSPTPFRTLPSDAIYGSFVA